MLHYYCNNRFLTMCGNSVGFALMPPTIKGVSTIEQRETLFEPALTRKTGAASFS